MKHSLAKLISEVDNPIGRKRLAEHLAALPFPHYEAHPKRNDLLIRIEEDGTRTAGRFVTRVFIPIADS
jgi:hypothetical protein